MENSFQELFHSVFLGLYGMFYRDPGPCARHRSFPLDGCYEPWPWPTGRVGPCAETAQSDQQVVVFFGP